MEMSAKASLLGEMSLLSCMGKKTELREGIEKKNFENFGKDRFTEFTVEVSVKNRRCPTVVGLEYGANVFLKKSLGNCF